MEAIAKPNSGWKSWFDEKLDRAEIKKYMLTEHDGAQEKLDKFLKKITSIKIRLDYATQEKKEYTAKIAELQDIPKVGAIEEKLNNLREEIKKSKKHLEATLESMSQEVSELFELPDFSKIELCSNNAISIGAKNEIDWDFDGTHRLSKECFINNELELKKAINPWVRKQLDMGIFDFKGIQIKQRLKVKATLKRNRKR